jgi:hypothetical protein
MFICEVLRTGRNFGVKPSQGFEASRISTPLDVHGRVRFRSAIVTVEGQQAGTDQLW